MYFQTSFLEGREKSYSEKDERLQKMNEDRANLALRNFFNCRSLFYMQLQRKISKPYLETLKLTPQE